VRGSFKDVINQALNQTLSRTIITSGTVFLATMSLYLFGGGAINDFAFTFLVGIITGTYSSIYIGERAGPVVAQGSAAKTGSQVVRRLPRLSAAKSYNYATCCIVEITPWHWVVSSSACWVFLALDLGPVFHRKAHVVTFKEALGWTTVWFWCCGTFWLGVVVFSRKQEAVVFATGYFIEVSLSMDNVFVIALIFTYFRSKVNSSIGFYLGILGALLMRGMMIWVGIELINGLTGYCTGLACCCCSRDQDAFRQGRGRPGKKPRTAPGAEAASHCEGF